MRKGTWYCLFRIVQGKQIVDQDVATGGDALDAIVKALQGLRERYRRSGLRAYWNEFMEPSGLPFYVPRGLGRRFDQQVERAVKKAVEILVRERRLKRERAHRSRQLAKRKPRN